MSRILIFAGQEYECAGYQCVTVVGEALIRDGHNSESKGAGVWNMAKIPGTITLLLPVIGYEIVDKLSR